MGAPPSITSSTRALTPHKSAAEAAVVGGVGTRGRLRPLGSRARRGSDGQGRTLRPELPGAVPWRARKRWLNQIEPMRLVVG